MDSKEFGKHIENLRLQAGYKTIESLAQASQVWGTTITRIEEGRTKSPSFETLKKLAPFLKVSYEELLKAAGYLEDDSTLTIEMTDGRTYTELNRAIKDLTSEEQKAVLQFIKFTKAQRDENK
jgi:transcriptional regulator with XRE-family HTH domain